MDGENPYAGGTQIGQGWAQVFKPFESPYLDRYIGRLEKQKEEESATTKGIIKELSALDKIDVLPGDVPRFAEKQNEIRNYVRENIDALRGGDIKATLDFQEKLNQYSTLAANSKKYREEGYDFGKAMALASDKFSDEQRALHGQKMQSSFNEDGTPRVYNYADIEKIRPRWDAVKFWKDIKNSYDPSTKTYRFQDPKSGVITTISESDFQNPGAIAKDMMMNPNYNEHVRADVALLQKEDPDAYKTLEDEAAKDTKNIYDQYAKREFQQRMPTKQLDSETIPSKMLEGAPRIVVNLNKDNKEVRTGGRTTAKGINWSVAESVTPGKAKETKTFDPKNMMSDYDLINSNDEYKRLYRLGLLSLQKEAGSNLVKSVTIYEPQTTTEMPLTKPDGTDLQAMVLRDGGSDIKAIPTSLKYNKSKKKWQLIAFDPSFSTSYTLDYDGFNRDKVGINPEQELIDAKMTGWIPSAGKAAGQPSKAAVSKAKTKAPPAPPSKAEAKETKIVKGKTDSKL